MLNKINLLLILISLNFLKCFATKECYFCIGPAEECGDVEANPSSMACDQETHTCATYSVHFEELTGSTALILRACDDLTDCANLDTSPYGNGTCQCLREGCQGDKCNNQKYTEEDIIDKADIGIPCLHVGNKKNVIVAVFGNESVASGGGSDSGSGAVGGGFGAVGGVDDIPGDHGGARDAGSCQNGAKSGKGASNKDKPNKYILMLILSLIAL